MDTIRVDPLHWMTVFSSTHRNLSHKLKPRWMSCFTGLQCVRSANY